MKKQKLIIIFGVILIGIIISIYQYSEILKTEVASATSTVPNPGHLWSSIECNSDSLCVDNANNRLGIGTASPAAKLHVLNATAANDTDTNTLRIAGGADGTLGPINLNVWSHPSATAGSRYVRLQVQDSLDYRNLILQSSGGNVGIGAVSPGRLLEIRNSGTDSTSSQLRLNGGSSELYSTAGIDFYGTSQVATPGPVARIYARYTAAGWDNRKLIFQSGIVNQAGLQDVMTLWNGNVGIGTATPGYALTVVGTAWATSGAWSGSDARWKKNIVTLSSSSSLEKVMALNPVTYSWRTDEFPEMKFSDGAQLGFIAQDVEKIIPEVVTTNNEGYKGISYEKIVPVLTSAIQEQEGKIDKQQAQIEQLKTIVCLDHPLLEICK
jgi:hypothetical protein